MRLTRTAQLIAVMLVAVWLNGAEAAYVPEQINYQGRITNTGGLPFNGVYDLTFTIYDAPTGGTALWTETHTGVAVASGLFSIILGTTTPITTTVLATDSRWLGVALLPAPEMSPRTKITSVAYAIKSARSDTANYVVNNSGGDNIWSLNGNDAYRPNGRVGIGIGSPASTLHLYSSTIPPAITLQDQFTPGGGIQSIRVIGGLNGYLSINSDPGATFVVHRSTGNIGIGTVNPKKQLHVLGEGVVFDNSGSDVKLWGASDNIEHNHYLQMLNATGLGNAWGLKAGGILVADNYAFANPAKSDLIVKGSVGIGTATPGGTLHVMGSAYIGNNIGDAAYRLSLGASEGSYGSIGFGFKFTNSTDVYSYAVTDYSSQINFREGGFDFRTAPIGTTGATINYTNAMHISQNGNVGIGTTSPSTSLDVLGPIRGQTSADLVNAITGTSSGNYSGIAGVNTGAGTGVYGTAPGPGYAGYFSGNVYVTRAIGINRAPDACLTAENTGDGVGGSFRNNSTGSVTLWVSNAGNGEAIACGNSAKNRENYVVHVIGYNNAASSKGLWVRGETTIDGAIIHTAGALSTTDISASSLSSSGPVSAQSSQNGVNAITGTSSANYSGVAGINNGAGNGIYGSAPGPGFAGYFSGKLCYTGTLGCSSDKRFKENVRPIVTGLEKVSRLRGVNYMWKRNEFPDRNFAEGNQIGFIAQEVQEVVPEVVSKGPDGYMTVDYARLTAVLVEAVKELKSQNEALSKRIDSLEAQSKIHATAESPR